MTRSSTSWRRAKPSQNTERTRDATPALEKTLATSPASVQQQTLTRDALRALKLGAAKKEAGRAYHLVDIQISTRSNPSPPKPSPSPCDATSCAPCAGAKAGIRNLRAQDAPPCRKLQVAATHRDRAGIQDLKHDLAIRPIYRGHATSRLTSLSPSSLIACDVTLGSTPAPAPPTSTRHGWSGSTASGYCVPNTELTAVGDCRAIHNCGWLSKIFRTAKSLPARHPPESSTIPRCLPFGTRPCSADLWLP